MRMSLIFVIVFLGFFSQCKERKAETSELEGDDEADLFASAAEFRNDPKFFLEKRRKSGRLTSECADLAAFNRDQLLELNTMNLNEGVSLEIGDGKNRVNTISKADATLLYAKVSKHPVAELGATKKYDPEGRGIGYCFGRAMTAHLEALFHFNIKNSSLRKLFAVGSLKTGTVNWAWHVTTIIKATEGGWWAIDPIMGQVLSAEEWYQRMLSNYNSDKKDLLLFHDKSMRFAPTTDAYKLSTLNNDFYHNYFKDLLQIYKTEFRKANVCSITNPSPS